MSRGMDVTQVQHLTRVVQYGPKKKEACTTGRHGQYHSRRHNIIREGVTRNLGSQLRTGRAAFLLSCKLQHSGWYSYFDQATLINSSTSENSSFGLSMAAKCPPVSCLL